MDFSMHSLRLKGYTVQEGSLFTPVINSMKDWTGNLTVTTPQWAFPCASLLSRPCTNCALICVAAGYRHLCHCLESAAAKELGGLIKKCCI